MGTKTFSSRADEKRLAYAEALTREQFGMSFGQYCGSILLEAVCSGIDLPRLPAQSEPEKASAIARLKTFSKLQHNPKIGEMSDDEIKNMIASRYE